MNKAVTPKNKEYLPYSRKKGAGTSCGKNQSKTDGNNNAEKAVVAFFVL